MARLDLDLGPLTAARKTLQDAVAQQRVLDRQLTTARKELDTAVRAGASPNTTVPLQQRVKELESERASSARGQVELRGRIDALANGLLQQRDPSALVEAMDGRQPIALLPVRLETRYFPPFGGQAPIDRLRIRVYPDDIQTISHMPALTADEERGGVEYWTARFAHDDDEAARVLRDLALVFGRGRAAWIVRVLTPENAMPGEGGGEVVPQFPAVDAIDARAKATRAVLLPDRWCAIGYAAGRREIFRSWGARIPDELLLSPDWLATDDAAALLGGERAWMVDFAAALANGMAIEVTQADINSFALRNHAQGFNLASGTIERLVVVGFEWTKGADDCALELADLLAAHRDSSGLGFVPLGTPTNNTEAAPAGYSVDEEKAAPVAADESAEKDALELTSWAFGLAPDALPPDNIANAHLCEQRNSLHMMNVLFRGTFGQYLLELWNPPFDEDARFFKTAHLYALRNYAVSYVRPTGPLPVLRIAKQPYGILPMVGRRFVDPGGSPTETGVAKVLKVLRPMWELAATQVPLLKDGDVDRAKDALQTGAWSQTAFYRDKDAGKAMCKIPNVFSDAQQSSRGGLIKNLLAAVGVSEYWLAHIYSCSDFLPDPPYSAGYLAGVPWVLADERAPAKEAADAVTFAPADNYLAKIAQASTATPSFAAPVLYAHQSGPALLQALVAFSVQKEKGDAVETLVRDSVAAHTVASLATTKMPYVEAVLENEATFVVQTPKELASVSIASLTGKATLGEHVAATLAQEMTMQPGPASTAATRLFDAVRHIVPQTRNLGATKLSLDYLSTRSVGELNVAFRSTLDCFSYRLDAWITARANRRLDQMRDRQPTGIHLGGFAWVEKLKADERPDSDGYLLAPSLGQAASAAMLRSGFMANREQGAFDIALDSRRTRRALDILQGLTADQPLAALYGYRIERGLRDALLGKFIWPLRLAYPWRPAGADPGDEPKEAVGARDVVDGVALLDAWETGEAAVRARLATSLAGIAQPAPTNDEWNRVRPVVVDALDLADSVSDLLIAEGTHQAVRGDLERAAAAMGIVDKQSLPIETQVQKTPRGGASYTQRIVALCPDDAGGWPVDRRSAAEPALNAWIASLLGDPARFRFTARVFRAADAIDADPVVASWNDLALSPLSAVMLSTAVSARSRTDRGETGFRSAVVGALLANLVDAPTVTGLDIEAEPAGSDFLGLAHFEALATTVKALIDRARPVTRKDLVRPDDAIESGLPDEGEYPGVDLADIESRADAVVSAFDTASAPVLAAVGANALIAALDAFVDFMPRSAWPAEVFAIDAAGADPGTRDARAAAALPALQSWITAKHDAATAAPKLIDGQAGPTHAQRVAHAIARIKTLFGRDFPVLPRCRLGDYATEFGASLGEQASLTVDDPWCVHGWLAQVARVREGADRFAASLSGHEALVAPGASDDFALVQWPHREKQVWAALPDAWVETDGTPFDPKSAPEELHAYLTARPGAARKDIQRVAPDLAIALHRPGGLPAPVADTLLAGLVCDEWPEFIPDPFQTCGIGFHYDAPGARPPQSVLLALPPKLDQDAWTFDDVMDVIHEAFDLAKLRGVRPRDLGGGLGALLPGNYLPESYTDDLPSVQVLKMRRDARSRLVTATMATASVVLGKI